jgi:hypothetical protein
MRQSFERPQTMVTDPHPTEEADPKKWELESGIKQLEDAVGD